MDWVNKEIILTILGFALLFVAVPVSLQYGNSFMVIISLAGSIACLITVILDCQKVFILKKTS